MVIKKPLPFFNPRLFLEVTISRHSIYNFPAKLLKITVNLVTEIMAA